MCTGMSRLLESTNVEVLLQHHGNKLKTFASPSTSTVDCLFALFLGRNDIKRLPNMSNELIMKIKVIHSPLMREVFALSEVDVCRDDTSHKMPIESAQLMVSVTNKSQ